MAIDDMQNNEALLETEDVDVPWYLTLVNYKNPIMDAEKDSDIHLVKLNYFPEAKSKCHKLPR